MKRKKKLTQKKNFMLLIGISLSVAVLCSGMEAVAVGDNLVQPLLFNSIVNPHSLINVDGIAFMCGNSKTTTDKKTITTPTTPTTETTPTKVKSGKKTVSDQKNSTSRRGAIID